MNQYQAIQYKGINRAAGRLATDGILEEQINITRRNGMLRPVGSKSLLHDYSTNLTDYAILYRHPVLPDNDLIGYRADTGEIHRIITLSESSTGANDVVVIGTTSMNLTATLITHLGNILMVHNDTYALYFVYDPVSDSYTQLPDLPIPQFMVESDRDRKGGFTTEEKDTLAEAVAEYVSKYAELRTDGSTEGHLLCTLAYRMFDGNYIGHSQLVDCLIGDANYQRLSKANAKYQFIAWYAKPKGKYKYQSGELTNLADWKGLITSVCLFATLPISNFNTPEEEDLYTLDNGDSYYLPGNRDIVNLNKAYTFYKIHEIGIETLTSGSEESEFEINLGNIDTMATREILPVDFGSHHRVLGSTAHAFNDRIHLGDIVTRLCTGLNMNAYADNEWPSSTLSFYDLVNYHWGYTGYSVKTPADQWTLSFVVTVQTSDGEKHTAHYLHEIDEEITIWEHDTAADLLLLNPVLSYPDIRATKIQFYLYDFVAQKYYRSEEYALTPNPIHNFASYLNYDETTGKILPIEIDLTAPGTEISAETYEAEVVTPYDVLVHDSNRVQVSANGNPFVYPAENSYRIGSLGSEVRAIRSVGEAISQGQFGQFPLYIFTSEGIWTLEQGSGEILYQSTHPISPDVVDSGEQVVGTGRGVAYITDRGLFLMEGNQSKEISILLEGRTDNPLSGKSDYEGYLSDWTLVELYPYLCSQDFKSYLQGSILGYDPVNREIIVSYVSEDSVGNANGLYSYVFSMETGEWYKITQNFSQFLNAYPDTWGVDFDKIYSMSQEETTDREILIQSRPMTLGRRTFKKVVTILQSGYLEVSDEHFAGLYLYGSQDGKKWYLLGGKQQGNLIAELSARGISASCKYFIVVFCGSLSLESVIDQIEVEFQERYGDKMR